MRRTQTWVTGFEADTTDDGIEVEVTVRRYPANALPPGVPPQSGDLPRDVRDALAEWLGRDDTYERLVDAVRRIHNPGDDGVLAPGAWCVADGEEWPCPTMRVLAEAGTREDT